MSNVNLIKIKAVGGPHHDRIYIVERSTIQDGFNIATIGKDETYTYTGSNSQGMYLFEWVENTIG